MISEESEFSKEQFGIDVINEDHSKLKIGFFSKILYFMLKYLYF